MGFDAFLVTLEPEQPVYIPGQAVTGYLRVISANDVSCRGITVTIKGLAKVHWSEKKGKSRQHYRAEEMYFRHPVTVWSGEATGNNMSPGDRKFPFSFVLPRDIPSSFQSYFGKVIYQVKAEADRPWSLDQSHKVYFSVNFMYDLNQDPLSLIPIRINKEKTVCCCCCAQGPIELSMTAQRSGYVPGESIIVDGEVVNHSGSTIKYTEIKLVQAITYITKSKNKMVDRTVQRVYHPQLEGGSSDVWFAVPLPIPAVPASHLKHCNIITIDYTFVLLAKLGTCKKARAKVPVIIGSLPLQGTYNTFLSPSGSASIGGTTLATSLDRSPNRSPNRSPRLGSLSPPHPTAPPPLPAHRHPPSAPASDPYSGPPPPYSASFLPDEYREVPPPSYASCVFGGAAGFDDGAEDSDAGEYAPRYLTYRTH